MSQIPIFGTQVDLKNLLKVIEQKKEIQFVETGLFDSSALKSIDSLANFNSLGIAKFGDANHIDRYLVAERNFKIEIRKIPQRSGGTKYAIDQLVNPKTIVFGPGGLFKNQYLIDGSVGTVSDAPVSLELFSLFKSEIRKQFKKIKAYYVGIEALELLNKGYRLTHSVQSPTLYDLKIK